MQKTRNKRRLLLLVVLTALTLLVFWWIQPENRLDVEKDIFQVEDLSTISKVELVSDSGKVSLAYDGGRWLVNDSLPADPAMIRVLFATLQQAVPKRGVTRASRDSILRQIVDAGVKVTLYAGDQLEKEFFAGGNPGKTQAYFADSSSGHVYVMNIPGYRVYVSGILELGENGWRDKFVFNFNWRNFKTLEVRFPETPSENFKVSMQGQLFGIEGMQKADTAKLNTFLDELSLLAVNEYVSGKKLADSLARVQPEVEFLITDIGNRTYRLGIYENTDGRSIWGLIGGRQVAVFDRRKIQGLVRQKSFFNQK